MILFKYFHLFFPFFWGGGEETCVVSEYYYYYYNQHCSITHVLKHIKII